MSERPPAMDLARLCDTLARATGMSARILDGGGVIFPRGDPVQPQACVILPEQQVVAVERVSMWLDGGDVCLGMWPAELKAQFASVYAHPEKVRALVALAGDPDWDVEANLHIAYRFARPAQRWYPARHLSGVEYLHQWIKDCKDGRARGRSREELADSHFRHWLTGRHYADQNDLAALDGWLEERSPNQRFHIRPGIEIRRNWPAAEWLRRTGEGQLGTDVRQAIDRVLAALGEPTVGDLNAAPSPGTMLKRIAAQVQNTTCPACHLQHAGECW